MNWLDRKWTFDLEPGVFPALLKRLRGTPSRAAELIEARKALPRLRGIAA